MSEADKRTLEEILLSRSGITSSFGKSTEEVKARIPFEIKEGFTRIAHENHMTESELLRELVMIRVLGLDMVRRLNEERLLRVAGTGHEGKA